MLTYLYPLQSSGSCPRCWTLNICVRAVAQWRDSVLRENADREALGAAYVTTSIDPRQSHNGKLPISLSVDISSEFPLSTRTPPRSLHSTGTECNCQSRVLHPFRGRYLLSRQYDAPAGEGRVPFSVPIGSPGDAKATSRLAAALGQRPNACCRSDRSPNGNSYTPIASMK